MCAAALHAAALGLGWLCGDRNTARELPDAGSSGVEVDLVEAGEPARVDESEPGGGSLDPDDSEPAVAGVANPTNATRMAPVIVAPEPESDPLAPPAPPARLTDDPTEVNEAESALEEFAVPDQELFDDFLLATDLKPRVARVSMIAPRRPSGPALGAATHDSRGRHLGYGPGANGGPGGVGQGWGKAATKPVSSRRHEFSGSPFGGRSGAWRGEICFLPYGTTSLKTVGSCPRAGELRTDVINISPRKFDQGFPGVTNRYEYFAIKYTGSFTVRETGDYRFRVRADDGAILTIDDQRTVDNDGVHEPISRSRSVFLSAGQHTFRLTYFQGPRYDIALQVWVKPPHGRERLFRPVI